MFKKYIGQWCKDVASCSFKEGNEDAVVIVEDNEMMDVMEAAS